MSENDLKNQTPSEALTPFEIKNRDFKRVLWGYCPKEVVSFLDGVAKSWEGVQKNERKLRSNVEELHGEIEGWKSKETEIDQMRRKALEDSDQIRMKASQEAQRILFEIQEKAGGLRSKTEAWLEEIITRLETEETKHSEFKRTLREVLDRHYALLGEKEAPRFSNVLQELLATKG